MAIVLPASREICAPTPMYRIAPSQAHAGSELESILAEKGTTGENLIRPFPKIKSNEDFSRLVREEDVVAADWWSTNHLGVPLRCSGSPGLDDMPSVKSFLDMTTHDGTDSPCEADGTSDEETDFIPPTRSSNPFKTHLLALKKHPHPSVHLHLLDQQHQHQQHHQLHQQQQHEEQQQQQYEHALAPHRRNPEQYLIARRARKPFGAEMWLTSLSPVDM
ncbi:hypothetical protein DIPPA_12189 [Diplonema papillatum]|nr:hypothetical protein DIPPA_12189 [Diplonema papillatum]